MEITNTKEKTKDSRGFTALTQAFLNKKISKEVYNKMVKKYYTTHEIQHTLDF